MNRTEPLPCFRLVGEADGGRLSFVLAAGAYTVGTDPACEVVLPVRGVSRRHARLEISPAGVGVRDLGSKNGSYVNDQDGDGQLALIGDELRFGPVTLHLRGADPEEAVLGLVLDAEGGVPGTDARGGPGELPSLETTWIGGGETPDETRLEGLGALLDHLLDLPEADLAGALGAFSLHQGTTGAALVEWTPPSASVALATAGTLGPVPELLELPIGHGSDWQVLPLRAAQDPPATAGTLVVRRRPGGAQGLLLWGEPAPASSPRELLVTVARLLAHFESGSPALLDSTDGGAGEGAGEGAGADEPARDGTARSEASRLRLPDLIVRGRSPAMTALYHQMALLLQGDVPVLILGETGVGKEHLALALHESGPRRQGPFIAVNCAAIPKELLEAEMFGIGKGVATGVQPRRGKFSEAEGGTLFLDEIGEMPAELQAKLLRALQEKEIHPLGRAPEPTDVRVLAATNTDLRRRIRNRAFRQDLYYRLAGYVLEVPALRQRNEDIPLLVAHFLRRFCAETGRPVRGVTVKALRLLATYAWPGNVRELEHEIRRLVFLCPPHRVVEADMLSAHIADESSGAVDSAPVEEPARSETEPFDDARPGASPAGTSPTGASRASARGPDAREGAFGSLGLPAEGLDAHLQEIERTLVARALQRAAGNQSAAARLLHVSRNGLAKRIKRLGLDVGQYLP